MTAKNWLLAYIGILMMSQSFVSIAQTNGDSLSQIQPKESIYDRDISSRWIRELRNVIIVSPRNETLKDTFNVESPGKIYLGTEGLTITNIRIIRLNPFGASVSDIADNIADYDKYGMNSNLNWVSRAGNAIHVNTGEFIIRNVLLFKEGDKINSLELAYSERYLRSMRYINDARVNAIPVSENEAEVIVVVHDILPYSGTFESDFLSRANFSITNRNIVGLGIEMRAGVFLDTKKDHLMGYQGLLRISNIGNSFISFQADYIDKYENQRYGFTLSREFYAPSTKYAGHIVAFNARTPVRYSDPSGKYIFDTPINIRYHYIDVWLGRSFQMKNIAFNKQQKNITISIAAQKMHFIDRPEKSEELSYKFQNRNTYLASFTYSQKSFYKSNLIYNFGRTEDIPYGYTWSVISGKEVNEKYNRPYFGANFSSGYFIPSFGYLSGAVAFGTFFHDGADQGLMDIQMNYFTPLYIMGKNRLRTFVNGQYTKQLNNRLEDKLMIDDELGIPGFRNDSVFGRHRLNLSMEQDFFHSWNIYGFRMVTYGFVHFSWLGGYDKPIILSSLYSSFGIGFRIRNNRLVINTLQIQFAYFPNIPKNSKFRYIDFSTETVLQPRDFKPRAPEVIPLN